VIRRASLILALAGALALVPGAAALTIQMAAGDTVDVVGTKLACFFIPSKTVQGIGCYQSSNKGLTVGTYGVAISQTGDTIVTRVNAKGAPITLWGSRKKASARGHATRYFSLTKGDSFGFRIAGIDTGCTILDLFPKGDARYQGRRVVCFRSKKTKPLPNSYGVVVSNKFAGSFRFDAKGNPGPTTFREFQP
jgi:hypothetical protein